MLSDAGVIQWKEFRTFMLMGETVFTKCICLDSWDRKVIVKLWCCILGMYGVKRSET